MFDGSLKKQQLAIKTALSDCDQFIQALRDLYSAVPAVNDLQASEKEKFSKNATLLKERITHAGKLLKSLRESIDIKKANLIAEIDIAEELLGANIASWSSDISEQTLTVNNIISAHNTIFETFKTLQQDAFQAIRNHVFAEERGEWEEKTLTLTAAQAQLKKVKGELEKQKEITDKLGNELREQGVAANKVSELLKGYLGHSDVRLQSVDDGYQLVRSDGKVASNLSEGEKTGLAFCFFLTQFEAEGRNAKDLIVVIDDPVSSLDTSAKTHAFSLMRKMTKKCAQTIILTHNMPLMNMVKREFRNKNSDGDTGLLQIQCEGDDKNNRRSSLCRMNKLLADYDTEYHYLFEIVFNANKNKSSDFHFLLPNATRKMLEMFVAFAAPTQTSFATALGESGVTLTENNLKSLERLVQIESHGTMNGMGSLPALTVEEAINASGAAMEFIRKRDPKHYKAMKKMCEDI